MEDRLIAGLNKLFAHSDAQETVLVARDRVTGQSQRRFAHAIPTIAGFGKIGSDNE